MQIKTRTILILIATFIFGILVGVISTNIIFTRRIEDRMKGIHNPRRFIDRVEKTIQPTEKQSKKLREILRRHHQKITKMGIEFREQMTLNSDSMKIELDSILTDEQMQKMDRLFKRRDRFRPRPPVEGERRPPDRRRPN